MTPQEKLSLLQENITLRHSLTVAFSGGVDSTFLLKAAHDILNNWLLAVIVRMEAFPEREFKEAENYVKEMGIKYVVLPFDEFNIPGFSDNPPDRCYLCKKALFREIIRHSKAHGIDCVADGSNLDDLLDYRPGMKAVRELGIVSPLQEAGMTKDDIRILSREMGLSTWNKPSFACLASRFPFGDKITREKMHMVDQGEEYLISLGFDQVRVRCHGKLARIEVAPAARSKFFSIDLMDQIVQRFTQIGFSYVSLDLQGYRTGSTNNQDGK
jgi:uncharacterized protein